MIHYEMSNFIVHIKQVVKLHRILEKAAVKASPTVLWCYKKELGFGRFEI